MLWFQRYELLESRTRGNSVKLKTTFNLSRELLAPPEPPSQRRVYFSSSLLFHLSTNCYQDMSMQHVTALY